MPRDGKYGSDIFANYLLYTKDTEPPVIYHRWCYLTSLGATIGRKAHIDLGVVGRVFPTMFIMLLGEPAARKSTAIKIAKRTLGSSGYDKFSADKTTKEKFLLDLEGVSDELLDENEADGGQRSKGKKQTYDATTAENLWGNSIDEREAREVFIVADEFNEFSGTNNLDFFTTLGNLWDFDSPEQPFTQRLKNSRSVSIYQPTISILAGNTPELFARCFPPEAIGSGFLSRLLLVHGERSGRRITFPPPPDAILAESITNYLRQLSTFAPGKLQLSAPAMEVLDDIYQNHNPLTDIRFKAYNNRRFTQLLKLCIILACGKFQSEVEFEDVIQANTILSHAELLMPRAMGEFGKNKNSDVVNKIMDVLDRATKPMTMKGIWTEIGGNSTLNKVVELVELMRGLVESDKVQQVAGTGGTGFLPKKAVRKEPKHVDWEYLSKEERDML